MFNTCIKILYVQNKKKYEKFLDNFWLSAYLIIQKID